MNNKEVSEAKKWLSTIPFTNANKETFLRTEESPFHSSHLAIEDVKSEINSKYPNGLKGFKKDLALNQVKKY